MMAQPFKDNIKPTNFIWHGQWNPPEDEVAYVNYFSDNRKGFYIECGAGYMGKACVGFYRNLGWLGINLEASKYWFKSLQDIRPEAINLNMGLSNKEGIMMFRDIIVAPGGGHENGSFTHTPAHKKELDGYNCTYDEYEVPVTTISALVEKYSISEIDLLSLDAEGHEIQILEGMIGSRVLPEVVCVEYPISGLNNIKSIMSEFGYNFNFISFNNAFFSFIDKETWFGATERMPDYDISI